MLSKRSALILIAISFPLTALLTTAYPGVELVQSLALCVPLYQWAARDLEECGFEPRSTSLPLIVAIMPFPGVVLHCFRSRRPRAASLLLLKVAGFSLLCLSTYELTIAVVG